MSSKRLDGIYARFEDRFRGSRQEIVSRLSTYAPVLELYERGDVRPSAIDYGCGRGEWLELLRQRGWHARGVDLNVDMLRVAQESGLDVKRADAIAHLSTLPSESVDLISAFHLVEHLPTEMLLEFIGEVARVVRPGGLLILETPNPENVLVGTCNFHLDPTHENPLPPALLKFFVEDAGATVAEIVRLNGERDLVAAPGSVEAAIRPMFTQGLDYAVIATRSQDSVFIEELRRVVSAIDRQAPIDLAALAAVDSQRMQTDHAVGTRLSQHDDFLSEAQVNQARLAGEVAELRSQFDAVAQTLKLLERSEEDNKRLTEELRISVGRSAALDSRLQDLQADYQQTSRVLADKVVREAQLAQQVAAIYLSHSWRFTAPLRVLTDLFRKRTDVVPRSAPASLSVSGPSRGTAPTPDTLSIDADPAALAAWKLRFASNDRKRAT